MEKSVREDVAFLKASPLINKDTEILGYSLEVKTGQLTVVE